VSFFSSDDEIEFRRGNVNRKKFVYECSAEEHVKVFAAAAFRQGDLMTELQTWLKELGLEQYASVLAENDIDLEILSDLSEGDLEKLGLSLGHRRKLLRELAKLQPDSALTTVAGPTETPPVTPATLTAERRQVTVLFSDLVGSTALANALDPEEMSLLIRRYQDACAGAIARFDGFIAKFMGDGVLAYFGYPQAQEDAVQRAVYAGLAVIESLMGLRRPDGEELATRIGIATGVVVIGDIIGKGIAREHSIVGETPNLAARLQSVAEPNSIVVSQSTHQLLGRQFDYQSLGEQTLKGFADPVLVWRVLREAAVASRFAAGHAATVGDNARDDFPAAAPGPGVPRRSPAGPGVRHRPRGAQHRRGSRGPAAARRARPARR